MFVALGRLAHRRRRWFLAVVALLTVAAGVYGPGVADAVRGGGFEDEGSESARAAAAVEEALDRARADVVVLWQHPDLPADDPAVAAEVAALAGALPGDAVEAVVHPWTPGLPEPVAAGMVGADGSTVMAVVTLAGVDADARSAAFTAVEESLHAPAPWTTHLAGPVPAMTDLQHRAEDDIVRAEVLAMPVLFVLMVLIFGSVTAAALPVVVGVVAILGAMGLLRLLTLATDVSTFALNVTTILGLGLAIDYALFMVSRFREELARGDGDVERAVRRTVSTAGRTVAFSGLTVLIAFAGLLFFPQMFLRSMGLGGMAVVLLDMVLALTLLPALLAVLGRRVDAGRLRLPSALRWARPAPRRAGTAEAEAPAAGVEGGWARLARVVLRRPGTVAVGATLLLAVVALPALDLRAGTTDVRDLPATSAPRLAADALAEQFPDAGRATLDVVVRGPVTEADLSAFVTTLADLPGVTGAAVEGADGATTVLAVAVEGAVDAPETQDLVGAVRDLVPPPGAQEVLVGGAPAVTVDSVAAISRTLPATVGFVAGVTVVLLFLALGSVLLPLKAVLMNVLSLGATVGAVVWAFDQGNLAGLLGFTETGRIDPSNLVLIAVIAFGLAMDYELFLLSRVREEHLRGAGPADAIAAGVQRSGRTITSAALLLVVVLAAMATSGITFLQLMGLGLAFAVAVDATVVRALLVPATVRLLGRAAWWLPGPLARLHRAVGVAEGDEPVGPVAGAPGVPGAPGVLVDGTTSAAAAARPGAPTPGRELAGTPR